jgi:hypothetical protein
VPLTGLSSATTPKQTPDAPPTAIQARKYPLDKWDKLAKPVLEYIGSIFGEFA